MAQYPNPIEVRGELNLRLGIKSSLYNLRSIVASLYCMYIAADKSSHIEYTQEYSNGGITSLRMKEALKTNIDNYFGVDKHVSNKIEESPLFKAQIEALQVGLELFFHLSKVSFCQSGLSERTGSNRYSKCLDFSTNILQLDLLLSSYPDPKVKEFLSSWIMETPDHSELEDKVLMMLAIFSEDTQCKIRTTDGEEVYFQREGIYQLLIKGETVVSEDAKEPVGPYRILKSYVSSGMHPFLLDKNKVFQPSSNTSSLSNYAAMVSTMLDLSPRRQMIIQEETEISAEDNSENLQGLPLQQIYYGAPGTGKSHATNEVTSNYPNTVRTTFHPDSDYSTFVGAYKPTMEEVEVKTIPVIVAGGITLEQNKGTYKEKKIVYKFVKQAFLKAYVKAWKLFKETCVKGVELAPQFLVIEEINRGNCAQIFGDLFQLLDRKQKFSEYPIDADADICKALLEEDTEDNPSFGADGLQLTQEQKAFVNQVFDRPGESSRNVAEKICNGQVLVLPPNLYIWATMNTSDQSLFPIDSAFKRRWEWKYVRISEGKDKNGHPLNFRIQFTTLEGKKVDESWWEFIQKINEKIEIATKSEDKKLGYFFCKPDKKVNETDEQNTIISAETFVGKVVFYLWQDVFKDYGFKSDIFKKEGNARLAFQDFYPNNIEPDEVKNPEGIDLNLVKKFINRVMDRETVETSTPAPTNSVTE